MTRRLDTAPGCSMVGPGGYATLRPADAADSRVPASGPAPSFAVAFKGLVPVRRPFAPTQGRTCPSSLNSDGV